MATWVSHSFHFFKDFCFFALSILLAYFLINSHFLDFLTSGKSDTLYVGALFAGLFFTSFFTTPPAIVVLGKIALVSNLWSVALLGATGALIGDMLIFNFVHKSLRSDLYALVGKHWSAKLKHIFHKRLYRRFAPFIAALIIASPLPDEPALALVGLEEGKQNNLELFMFVANFVGILLIGLGSRSLV